MQELSLRKIVRKAGLFAVALVSLDVLVGCGSMTAKVVSPSDLIGEWVSKSTMKQPEGKDVAKLSLTDDGKFEISNALGLFNIPPASPEPEGGSGTWKLVERDGRQQVQLTFTTKNSRRMFSLPYGNQLDVNVTRSKTTLFYSIGDPDNMDRVTFQRKAD